MPLTPPDTMSLTTIAAAAQAMAASATPGGPGQLGPEWDYDEDCAGEMRSDQHERIRYDGRGALVAGRGAPDSGFQESFKGMMSDFKNELCGQIEGLRKELAEVRGDKRKEPPFSPGSRNLDSPLSRRSGGGAAAPKVTSDSDSDSGSAVSVMSAGSELRARFAGSKTIVEVSKFATNTNPIHRFLK